jgi:hypothetical protein
MPLEFALLRLHTWDSVLLTDDFSLDAPWLRHALALDCFPLVPEGNGIARTPCWHGESAPQTYPWGEIDAALALLGEWREQKNALLPQFREWAGQVRGATPGSTAFRAEWNAVKEAFIEQRTTKLRPRKAARGWQSVAWYERLQRLRAGL